MIKTKTGTLIDICRTKMSKALQVGDLEEAEMWKTLAEKYEIKFEIMKNKLTNEKEKMDNIVS